MKKILNTFKEAFLLALGCFLIAIALNLFFDPFNIAPGGISGLSIVISSVTNLSLSFLSLLFNIPLFLIACKILSKKDMIKTLAGVTLLTLCLKLTSSLSNLTVTNDLLLATISGSVLLGVGLGIIFRINGTTGGTDLIGLLINKFLPFISSAVLMGIADFIVVVLSGIISKEIEIALYSALSVYLIVKVTDFIVIGFNYSKSFMIISDNTVEISNAIINNLGRGATLLKATGAYTNNEKNVVLVVISKRQVVTLKKIIKSIDPNAFIIVSDVHEALGEGFASNEV
jgi:uncharacterized membrane-anchored protein YitT (DUF2179 family)